MRVPDRIYVSSTAHALSYRKHGFIPYYDFRHDEPVPLYQTPLGFTQRPSKRAQKIYMNAAMRMINGANTDESISYIDTGRPSYDKTRPSTIPAVYCRRTNTYTSQIDAIKCVICTKQSAQMRFRCCGYLADMDDWSSHEFVVYNSIQPSSYANDLRRL